MGTVVVLSPRVTGRSGDSPQRPSGRATPILVYRVADYADATDRLRSAGVNDMRELERPARALCELRPT